MTRRRFRQDSSKTGPRIFISYANDSDEHREAVRRLWYLLRCNGVCARIDLSRNSREDWPKWIEKEIDEADFVLVIASPAYRLRADAASEQSESRGVRYEATLLRDRLYTDEATWRRKVLPVLLPGRSPDDIPSFLGPYSRSRYEVSEFTVDGAEKLFRVLTDQPSDPEPPLGSAPHLPPRRPLAGNFDTADGSSAVAREDKATDAEISPPPSRRPHFLVRARSLRRGITATVAMIVVGLAIRTITGAGDDAPSTSYQAAGPLNALNGLVVGHDGTIYASTSSGVVRLDAGGGSSVVLEVGDGFDPCHASRRCRAGDLELRDPEGLVLDSEGRLYIADHGNDRVLRLDADGTVTTVAGNGRRGSGGDHGPASEAELAGPKELAVDPDDNLYIVDHDNRRVRQVAAADGTITTIAGDGSNVISGDGGPADRAGIGEPGGIAVDESGILFIASYSAEAKETIVRQVSDGTVTTVAGDDPHATDIGRTEAIAVDSLGNVYLALSASNRVEMLDPGGRLTTVAGTGAAGFSGDGGRALAAELSAPFAVATDRNGALYIADRNNSRIRRVSPDGTIGSVTSPR